MPTFETNQPIVLSIEMSQGAVHVIASDRTDTVVAVNPSDRDRPEDVEAAGKTVVDLANGTLSIKAPKTAWHRRTPPRMEAGRLRRGDRGAPGEVLSTRRRRLRRLPMRWPSR